MTPGPAALASSQRRHQELARVRRSCWSALRTVLVDVRQASGSAIGPVPDRLVVFRAEPGFEQTTLTSVDVAGRGRRARCGLTGEDRALWTALYGDLLDVVSRIVGDRCPPGIVVAVDALMVKAYSPEHCGHWNGRATYELGGRRDDLRAHHSPEEGCCPWDVVPVLLQRHGIDAPTRRAPAQCDAEH